MHIISVYPNFQVSASSLIELELRFAKGSAGSNELGSPVKAQAQLNKAVSSEKPAIGSA